MVNKTDPYIDFDPTQLSGSGCCGDVVYNQESQLWEQRKRRKSCEEQLADAKQEIAALKEQLANTNAPTADECAVLEKYLIPVSDLSGKVTHFVIKGNVPCPNLTQVMRTDLNGNNATLVIDG